MSASAAAPPPKDYGLPAAGDVTAWENVMRPCTGVLQLYKGSGLAGCANSLRRRPTLATVKVWVHCGLHYKLVQRQANAACTPPVPGDMPPVDRPDSRFGFFPLPRDEPGQDPSVSVEVFCVAPGGDVRGVDGLWVVKLVPANAARKPLFLCAQSKATAEAWEHQLRMRSAPLAVVWSRHMGMGENGSIGGGGGMGAARGSPDEATQLSAVAALRGGARQVLDNDVLAGVAGVVAELTLPNAHNIAVAAGPLVGVAFGALGFALSVFVAARLVSGAAAGVSEELDQLYSKLRRHVLPAFDQLPDGGIVDVGDLINMLGRLVSGVEVLAGELHHLVRSRRQRFWMACMSAQQGLEVGADFQTRLSRSQQCADELVQLIQVGLQRQSAGAPLATAQQAARKGLRALPPNVFNDWGDPQLPASQLYAAVMMSDSTTCAAVGAHGMGGVGKTTSCLLVAHRIDAETEGKRRFPHRVHWLQLSERASQADVIQRVCDLATTLSGKLAAAHEMNVAVEHLRAAVQDKSCLVILDDVWEDRWAAVFIDALQTSPGSCLLFSTRRQDIATRSKVSQCISVNILRGATAVEVLMKHAEANDKVWADKTGERVQLAVDTCGGLALALAVVGSLLREVGWESAVDRVRRERNAIFSRPVDVLDVVEESKGSLWASLSASYWALDAIHPVLWRERFQALCVVRQQEQLPLAALMALWGENKEVVKEIAQTLRDRSLVVLHSEEDDATRTLSIHDLVVEFLAGPHVLDQERREQVHVKLMTKYCEHNCVGVADRPTSAESTSTFATVRALWGLRPDGFVERALPRLLCGGGAGGREELCVLLFDWRFISWRVAMGGGSCSVYRMDGRTYVENGHGVSVAVLDLLATVVEGAVAVRGVPLSLRLHQAAWEMTERLASGLHVAGCEAASPLLAYLCATARLCLDKPAVALYGASRLDLPRALRVFGCGDAVGALCRVSNSRGQVFLCSGEANGNLTVWEEHGASRVAVLKGHTGSVTCLAVVDGGGSGGGQRVVSGSVDGTVRVWEVDGGTCVAVLEGHTGWVTCLAVVYGGGSGGGQRVVSGSDDYTVRVWKVEGGTCVAVLKGHTSDVTCLAVVDGGGSGGGQRVVSGSVDGTVRVWEVDGGTCVAVLEGHTAPVTCLAVVDGGGSGGGQRVVSGSDDYTVRVWEVDGGTCVAVLEGHTDWVRCLAVVYGGGSGGGQRVVSGSDDGTVRVWEVDGGTCVAVLEGHTDWVRCLAVVDGGGSGGGQRVVSGSDDYTVRVWEVDGGTCVAVLEGHTDWVRCLAVVYGGGSGGGQRVVSGSDDGTVRVWEVDGGTCVAVLEGHTDWVRCLAVVDGGGSGGGQRVVSGSHDYTVRVWEVDGGTCVAVLKGHTSDVTCLAVVDGGGSGGGQRVVSGSVDGTVRVWEVDGGTCVAVLEGHTAPVTCLAVVDGGGSGGGQRVVSGSDDYTVRVWEVDGGTCVAVLEGHTDWVRCLAVVYGGGSGGGQRVVSGSDDGTVRVWEVDGGTCVAVLEGHTAPVTCLAVVYGGGSGGGQRVVSGSGDGTVRVWEVDGGTCVAVLEGHTGWVRCLAVVYGGGSGGGQRVVSGSDDGTVRVWEVDGSTCVAVVEDFGCMVSSLALLDGDGSDGGRRPASGSPEGDGRLGQVDGDPSRALLRHQGRPTPARVALLPLGSACALPASSPLSGSCVFVDKRGFCTLLDSTGYLRFLPAPPRATGFCCVSPDVVAWGTQAGRVFFGRVAP
ncbi:hypothetical protein I4F81_005506 [Pyropia yezoensis]|uniref:Uncharacterized protein n=1 Tax=Pyropia yezoensis TaxID=2788 RepID=A0ACC3BYW9_PYRYE|nr:hypothetical protein I4F81_005506 [Neopyropia yezoensis]